MSTRTPAAAPLLNDVDHSPAAAEQRKARLARIRTPRVPADPDTRLPKHLR